MTKDEIISTLKDYKRLIAIHESLLNDYEGVLHAQVLTDMPRAHGVHSATESAMNKLGHEVNEIKKEIKRVQIWLNYLNEEERFVIEHIYFEERFINHIINKWCNLGKEYHGSTYWKNKHRDAIRKITHLRTECVPIASTF